MYAGQLEDAIAAAAHSWFPFCAYLPPMLSKPRTNRGAEKDHEITMSYPPNIKLTDWLLRLLGMTSVRLCSRDGSERQIWMRGLTFALCGLALACATATRAAECPDNPDALGTSRTLVVDPT